MIHQNSLEKTYSRSTCATRTSTSPSSMCHGYNVHVLGETRRNWSFIIWKLTGRRDATDSDHHTTFTAADAVTASAHLTLERWMARPCPIRRCYSRNCHSLQRRQLKCVDQLIDCLTRNILMMRHSNCLRITKFRSTVPTTGANEVADGRDPRVPASRQSCELRDSADDLKRQASKGQRLALEVCGRAPYVGRVCFIHALCIAASSCKDYGSFPFVATLASGRRKYRKSGSRVGAQRQRADSSVRDELMPF